MKKLLPLFLSGALLLGAAGCSNSGQGSTPTPTPSVGNDPTPEASTPAASTDPGQQGGEVDYSNVKIAVLLSGPPTDGGYCQQGADGIRAIQAKYNLDDSQVSIIDSVTTAETAKRTIQISYDEMLDLIDENVVTEVAFLNNGQIWLTTQEDLTLARALYALYEGERGERMEMNVRIGQGYDVHRLTPGRKLILGGVEVPFERGLLGHSDADVLTHAIADAILGAAALGDIGRMFPDNDPEYAGADSILLLKEVCERLRRAGYEIGNIDATLIAQRPKIAPYVEQMRGNIAAACGLELHRVSVKATTEEGMGFTGVGDGMAAQAVCLLRKE